MRLKQRPGDFRVVEELEFAPTPHGAFCMHRLRKQKMDTQRALSIVARVARVPREAIAFAGMKDRQGQTEQWISIQGRKLDYRGDGIQIAFVGRCDEPVTSKQSLGNRFSIVIRDLDERDIAAARRKLAHLCSGGFANYFDDQRFGCLLHGQGFAMRDVLHGQYDRALHSLLACPSPVARGGDVKLKQLLRSYWGNWETCARIVRGPLYGRVFEVLRARPCAFREALESLPTRLKLIHAFAYQSFLWNRAVSRYLIGLVPGRLRVAIDTLAGRLIGFCELPEILRAELRNAHTPLHGSDRPGGDRAFVAAMRRVLANEGLTPEAFAGRPVRGMMLREEPRAVLVVPRDLEMSAPARDESMRGRLRTTVSFGLPRGSYATMLIKLLFASAMEGGGMGRHAPRSGMAGR